MRFELVKIDTLETESYDGYTYDLEVEEDHSYNIEGVVVHNSVCTTRTQTGVGVPQFSAIVECADAANGVGGHIIADGGCTQPGDVSKALAAGAHFVMLGSMLAGHQESESELQDGKRIFYGMSSQSAFDQHGARKDGYRGTEGKTVVLGDRGPVRDTVEQILGGVRSTCTYIGARRIKDMPKCAHFVRVNQVRNTSLDRYDIK